MSPLITLPQRVSRAWQELTGRSTVRRNYHASEYSRTVADWFERCMRPDDEMRGEIMVMKARGRDLARNDALVKQFLNILVMNVIGPRGPRLRARIRDARGELDKAANAHVESAFRRWASRPVSADRKLPLTQFAHLQLRTTARDGEGFTRPRFGGNYSFGMALQGIDPDIVDETYNLRVIPGVREIRLGVEVDADVAPLAYWIWDRGFYEPEGQIRNRYPIPASEIIHTLITERVHQVRGITWLAPVALLINHLERYNEAELVAARAGAAAVAFVVQTDASMAPNDDGSTPGASPQNRKLQLNPGTAVRLEPGEDVRSFTPAHPTTAFPDFNKSIMRRISTGLAVAYNTLCNDLEGVNYSSIRHGLTIERDGWEMLQEWWFSSFYTPIYESWLQAATLSGELRLPGADWREFADHEWMGRGWSPVDPHKDAQANQMDLDNGLTSHQRILGPRGEDFYEIVDELAEEKAYAAAKGVDITGSKVVTVQNDNRDGEGSGDGTGDGSGGSGDGSGDSSSRAARRTLLGGGAVATAAAVLRGRRNGKAH